MNARRGALFGIGLLGFAALHAACVKDDPREAERSDARSLEGVLAADQRLETELRKADGLSRTDETKAAELLETAARPLAEAVVQAATTTQVRSPWGKDRRVELLRLAEQRRDELPRYAQALRSPDPKTKLEALQTQIELQKKLLDAAQRITIVPP